MPKLIVTDDARAGFLEENRTCGDCCACCVLPRIPDLDKPGYHPCKYLHVENQNSGQCSTYDYRPDVCRDYLCLWRVGRIEGDHRRRPDQLGLMFGVDQIDGHPYFECWELWEGAARDYPGRGVLDAFAAQTVVLVRWYGVPCSLKYHGPRSLELGRELSRQAREEPARLADWLDRQVAERLIERPNGDDSCNESYRRGEPVQPWFDRSGRLSLPVASAM